MSSLLIIAGAVLQVAGLALVVMEVVTIRVDSLRAAGWLRALSRRPPKALSVSVAGHISLSGEQRTKLRPTPLEADATAAERVAWLERCVKYMDEDLDTIWGSIKLERDSVIANAAQRDQELRGEIDAREEQLRAQLRRSLIRQAIGSACIAAGLIVGTIGAVN